MSIIIGIIAIGIIIYGFASLGEIYSEGGCLAVIGALVLVAVILAIG